MSRPPDLLVYHVVANDEHHHSLWPEYRRDVLPPGWRLTGFSGTRAACLQHIAAGETPPPAPTRNPPARTAGRAAAVPFPRPDAPIRLFIFPHAGADASAYHFLARALKDDPVEVQIVHYPGRELRVKEPAIATMPAMLAELGADLDPAMMAGPCALFGHSLGALLAFEFARRLRSLGAAPPRRLFLSGRQAPQYRGRVMDVAGLDDAAFLDAVGRRYNALPPEVLAHREILDLVLPSLRADFALTERYIYQDAPPLDTPITLLNGTEDPWVDAESLAGWSAQTRYPVEQHAFPGGHFYLPSAIATVRPWLLRTVAAAAG